MTCQAFKPALNSMEVDAVGWDSDGLGYDTPGDDVDGDEHAEGAALEDLGPLRDKPAAAAAARARGQYGRAAALRKAIAPAANVHVAARRLRDLAGVPLRTVVQFGALGGRSGAAVQCLLVLQRHGHPAVEERAHGRPPGVSEDGAGHDSNSIVALTPARAGDGCAVARAVRACSGECVEVTRADMSADGWRALVAAHVPGLPVKDSHAALTLFRRAARIATGCNGEGVDAQWGTSVLVAVRREERSSAAKTLVFLQDGGPRAGAVGAAVPDAGAPLAARLACARGRWLCDDHLPSSVADATGGPLVRLVRDVAGVEAVCAAMYGGLVHRAVPVNSDAFIQTMLGGLSFAQRGANGGESFSGSSQESRQASAFSGSQASEASPQCSSQGTQSSPQVQGEPSPHAPAGRRERLSSVPSSPMNMSASPVVCMGSEHGGRARVSDSFLSANATLGDDSMDMDDRGVSACALTLEF